ncbi:MAG: sugar phosphate isomerase/epimerase [Clostridiaceae bacterium]
MKKFLIGMYGGFDEAKYKRDFRQGFSGVEACMFPDRQEANKLMKRSMADGFKFGIHYPFLKKDTPYRDPFFISTDYTERKEAMECFGDETAFAKEKGAEYILTHFPKPVLVDRSLDLRYWRFAGDKEWMYTDTYPIELLKENLYEMFDGLSDISRRYDMQIVLENDAMSSVLIKSSFLEDLFQKYSTIKVCLDIGRLHLQEKLDSSFDALGFTTILAPYTYLIHLWNTNPVQNLSGGHYPVLPSQKPSEGWADVEGFIEIIKRYNSNVKVLFEHRSDLISDEELNECYFWVEQMFGGKEVQK